MGEPIASLHLEYVHSSDAPQALLTNMNMDTTLLPTNLLVNRTINESVINSKETATQLNNEMNSQFITFQDLATEMFKKRDKAIKNNYSLKSSILFRIESLFHTCTSLYNIVIHHTCSL